MLWFITNECLCSSGKFIASSADKQVQLFPCFYSCPFLAIGPAEELEIAPAVGSREPSWPWASNRLDWFNWLSPAGCPPPPSHHRPLTVIALDMCMQQAVPCGLHWMLPRWSLWVHLAMVRGGFLWDSFSGNDLQLWEGGQDSMGS